METGKACRGKKEAYHQRDNRLTMALKNKKGPAFWMRAL
jgi:hypothetical protein